MPWPWLLVVGELASFPSLCWPLDVENGESVGAFIDVDDDTPLLFLNITKCGHWTGFIIE